MRATVAQAAWLAASFALAANAVAQETVEIPAPEAPAAVVETVPAAAEEKKPEPIEPLFVRPFTEAGAGSNDGNPVWSPSGRFLSFERSIGEKKEIHIALADGFVFQTIYYRLSGGGQEMKFFFPGVVEDVSYNAGITWSPDEARFAFMSNGGEGNYELFLGELGGKNTARLTNHKEKDGQPDWSPKADEIVFVSGRTGNGDLYLLNADTRSLARLTQGGKAHLYPQWSPDGRKIALIRGSNENHDIMVIADPGRPTEARKTLTTWDFDDIRPVWSPDGGKLAFYSNYNPAGDPKVWSIAVIAADGSDPAEGEGLAARIVAVDVIPDVERGPAWMPDNNRIVYVKNDRQEYNPLFVVNVKDKTSLLIKTDTKMNHDVACSADGILAFRGQVNQWDRIFIARLKE